MLARGGGALVQRRRPYWLRPATEGGGNADAGPTAVAKQLQADVALDFEPLAAQDLTLSDVVKSAEVAGGGRIIDVRTGYSSTFTDSEGEQAPDEVRRMLLVIKPDELAAGAELLGRSGEVILDLPAPALDRETGDRGIGALREEALRAPERVLFALRREQEPPDGIGRENPFAGRGRDDPLLVTVHPSSVLALRDDGTAFPLLTEETIREDAANLDAFRSVGVEIKAFTTAESALPIPGS